jgi:hypothetical protein
MKKKISRILSMVLVVGLIAAIPASTQILDGSSIKAVGESDLPMLILVNRLELSEEQMNALNDILSDLVDEREEMAGLTAEFEGTMIEFSGTEEELDALLVTFREEQQALAEALGESIEVSLDKVRDLLSINQGLVLQEELPQLLGGILMGSTRSNGRMKGGSQLMEPRMSSGSMGRAGMMSQRSSLGGQMPMQAGSRSGTCSGECEDEAPSIRIQGQLGERMGGRVQEEAEGMMGQRLGQNLDDETIGTMSERMQERFEQMGDQMPERMIERLGGSIEEFGAPMEHGFMVGQSGNGAASGLERMGQRGGASVTMQHMQSTRSGNLFDVFEQVADVLELKLEAME